MKTRTVLLGLVALLLAFGTARAATFEDANKLYDGEKYADAKAAYESLAASGSTTANLFYNLGNTEYRLKAPGRAAWNYERALALDPSHPEARQNLDLVRQQSGARLLPPNLVDRLLLPWSGSAYTLLAAIGAWLLVFGLYGIFISGRRESFRLWGLALLAVVAAAYGGLGVWEQIAQRSVAIILPRETVARVAPADRAQMVEPLPAGSQVRILSERGAWTYCELPGRGRGWLPNTALARLAPGGAA
jgi:hypothetical protein